MSEMTFAESCGRREGELLSAIIYAWSALSVARKASPDVPTKLIDDAFAALDAVLHPQKGAQPE